MINAGLRIQAIDGQQSYSTGTGIWSNVKVIVSYPTGQTVTANPISVNDLIIEPFGNVWKVLTVVLEDAGTRRFRVNITSVLNTPSEEISPNFGVTVRAGVVTPNAGLIAPYWDLSLVNDNVTRVSNLYNNKVKIGLEALPLGGPGGLVGLDETGKISVETLPERVPLLDTTTGKIPDSLLGNTGISLTALETNLSNTFTAITTDNSTTSQYVVTKLS